MMPWELLISTTWVICWCFLEAESVSCWEWESPEVWSIKKLVQSASWEIWGCQMRHLAVGISYGPQIDFQSNAWIPRASPQRGSEKMYITYHLGLEEKDSILLMVRKLTKAWGTPVEEWKGLRAAMLTRREYIRVWNSVQMLRDWYLSDTASIH